MIVKAEDLEEMTGRIFASLGSPREDADWIATLLVRANLRGHESHGVIRIAQYVTSVEKGTTKPTPTIRVLNETPTTAVIDGDQGFGQVVARRGMELAIEKARAQGLPAVAPPHTNPLGPPPDYGRLDARPGVDG